MCPTSPPTSTAFLQGSARHVYKPWLDPHWKALRLRVFVVSHPFPRRVLDLSLIHFLAMGHTLAGSAAPSPLPLPWSRGMAPWGCQVQGGHAASAQGPQVPLLPRGSLRIPHHQRVQAPPSRSSTRCPQSQRHRLPPHSRHHYLPCLGWRPRPFPRAGARPRHAHNLPPPPRLDHPHGPKCPFPPHHGFAMARRSR